MSSRTDKLLLLSTCGTSVLTHGATAEERSWLSKIANLGELSLEDRQRLEKVVAQRKDQMGRATVSQRRQLSAELNGIQAVLELWAPTECQHVLVHTDTAAGKAAVGLVADCLPPGSSRAQLLTSNGLRTDHAAGFREALADLTRQVEENWAPWRAGGWFIVFNLTGGFKSINAYLQALGMLHADRCVFLFESSPELMQIPRLPVRLAEAEELVSCATLFRKLLVGYPVRPVEAEGVPDSLLLVDGDEVTTSVWGDLVWSRTKARLLGDILLEPLSARVEVSRSAGRDFERLPADKKVKVHEALDALAAHLDNGRPLLKSQTFKFLQGNPCPPATHELYAWSDGATGRILGHFEQERFKVDGISGHL